MRPVLAKWISDADALHNIQRFGFIQTPMELHYIRARRDDYYISLVGELFDRIRNPYEGSTEWARLGNALTLTGAKEAGGATEASGLLPPETALFAAAAFYFGGYSASAYLTLKAAGPADITEIHRACYELIARPSTLQSGNVRALVGAVRHGELQIVQGISQIAVRQESEGLQSGPDEWVGWRLFRTMLARFEVSNVRAVLPEGESQFWDPLVRSLLNRTPPVWDFFPSQIEAVQGGLLESDSTYSLQMPTGAGKTALAETLLFYHLKKNPEDVAVFLVPFRSLASELRGSLVKRLNKMGLFARCAYGGTVPTGDEVRNLESTRAIVATPESLSGLLSAEPAFFARISLIICDEGHLLDSGGRGVGLELLLARMRARETNPPRVVFISAIVPNIEEINTWLGGSADTVVKSDYRPSLAEFSVLRSAGGGAAATVDLEMHPHENESTKYSIEAFLSRPDFQYHNPASGRFRTYSFSSVKTRAIASARKALSMGAVAVFAANKRGRQGAVGLAEELLKQLELPLPLAKPSQFVKDPAQLQAAVEYFSLEYGTEWAGTRVLAAGAILHHGDIPQESREVIETLVRQEQVRLAICTNTLAEGVNLPIRTLVLYSVVRQGPSGRGTDLLVRDIKNLVGRAGRAGATTKGLVICTNPNQWGLVEPVARQQPGERVAGALHGLMNALLNAVEHHGLLVANESLEQHPVLYPLFDGIDSTLIDLAAEELGEEELVQIAGEISAQTFAASQAEPESLALMREVFELRAQRVMAIKNTGRLSWIRETGTRARMLESVETSLLPLRERWDDIVSSDDPSLIETFLTWAWDMLDVQDAFEEAYRGEAPTRETFAKIVSCWVDGVPLGKMARNAHLEVDEMLGIHARLLSYVLQTVVEQGVALLEKFLEANDQQLSQAVIDFPEHLRFGVPTLTARLLASEGVRHRRAAVALGRTPELESVAQQGKEAVFVTARRLLEDEERWLPVLGRLVLENTKIDLGQE